VSRETSRKPPPCPECKRLRKENRQLRKDLLAAANRIAAQSDLLTLKAGKRA
jgi:hypothetical protein